MECFAAEVAGIKLQTSPWSQSNILGCDGDGSFTEFGLKTSEAGSLAGVWQPGDIIEVTVDRCAIPSNTRFIIGPLLSSLWWHKPGYSNAWPSAIQNLASRTNSISKRILPEVDCCFCVINDKSIQFWQCVHRWFHWTLCGMLVLHNGWHNFAFVKSSLCDNNFK